MDDIFDKIAGQRLREITPGVYEATSRVRITQYAAEGRVWVLAPPIDLHAGDRLTISVARPPEITRAVSPA